MAAPVRTFLSVERSIGGRRWLNALDERGEAAALAMAQRLGLPDLVTRVLAARGVLEAEATGFLDPRIRDLMPDPSTLTDMEAAAARIADAVERKEKVAIFGDYDVDGAASSAVLWRYLKHFGLDADDPHSRPDHRGLRPQSRSDARTRRGRRDADRHRRLRHVELRADRGARARLGVDVVVLDHHQTGPELPAATALVNPNRQDDLSGLGHLCAAGVVFMALVAISRELRRRGRGREALPDVFDLLDLVALATVCDVVPLAGLNRALVVQGLKVMHGQKNAGIAALARVARLSGPIAAHHLGFLIGPRINAGGRIGDAALGSRLLGLDDPSEARPAGRDAAHAERGAPGDGAGDAAAGRGGGAGRDRRGRGARRCWSSGRRTGIRASSA